jgi:chaperonin GroES
MKPLSDFVLINPDKPKDQTKSGIMIAEDWKTLPPTGKVIAVGPLVKEVKKGDRVVFMRYAVIDAQDGLKVAREGHIIATYA